MSHYTSSYFKSREERSKKAVAHTVKMKDEYAKEIEKSIKETAMFDGIIPRPTPKIDNVIVVNLDSVSAILQYSEHSENKTAVLNFASYKNPGGKFLDGSSAQEESLCHESFLYNVLKEQKDYYEWNRQHLNRSLYTNRALYTPDILFKKEDRGAYCDVITCAAPNKTAAQKYYGVSNEENSRVLRERIKFVLDIAEIQKVKILILGAFGCGVFGQDATEVASIFREYLITAHTHFDKVVFAIPEGRDRNYEKFVRVFS